MSSEAQQQLNLCLVLTCNHGAGRKHRCVFSVLDCADGSSGVTSKACFESRKYVQGGSNMTGTDSYLNHLVDSKKGESKFYFVML
jgi:hypothetical protein